jgi:hypothetical protein
MRYEFNTSICVFTHHSFLITHHYFDKSVTQ